VLNGIDTFGPPGCAIQVPMSSTVRPCVARNEVTTAASWPQPQPRDQQRVDRLDDHARDLGLRIAVRRESGPHGRDLRHDRITGTRDTCFAGRYDRFFRSG